MKISSINLSLLACSLFLSVATSIEAKLQDREPEAATGYTEKKAFHGKEFMVSAANPYASWVGKRVLLQGGSAMDAAVAIQAMLTLVEPQSSGIGGGAFILHWDNKNKVLETYDGRETAPAGVNAFLFQEHGKTVPWKEAVMGGRSVGVPGVLRALELAHKDHGKLKWQELFNDAARTAENGFTVSARLEKLVGLNLHPGLQQFHSSKVYFHPQNEAIKEGHLLKNKALTKVFLKIAEQGADAFYKGTLAEDIVEKVQNSINPGTLTLDDLANYEAKKREAVCNNYKQYKICGMPPPSSGGLTVIQILKMLEHHKMEQYQPGSSEAAHLFSQASRLAYADRSMYIADSDFTRLPFHRLINESYVKERSAKINLKRDMGRAQAGYPYPSSVYSRDTSYDLPNTTHFSIVDKEGNAVSMTSSIEFAFGSGLMVHGFLLNNQMTDFSFVPRVGKRWVLNRVEPEKRPRSSMSPTMVFDKDGELLLVIGSPGGSRIISYVAQSLIGILDWGLNVQQAINLPKITNRNDYTALEKGTPAADLEEPLRQLGHRVKIMDLNSGLHGIMIDRHKGELIGGADPRREGVVVGQ